jgi:hypothetical protein
VQGHAKAATKVGVNAMTAAFEQGKPYDFKNLGDVAGFAVAPQSGTAFNPPKAIAVNITRTIKMLAAREFKFHGFALQVAQDKSVDEGYITRIDLPKCAEIKLELDVYEKR